jgi:aconitate hydratase
VEFADPVDYDRIDCDDELVIDNLLEAIKGRDEVKIVNRTKSIEFVGKLKLSGRDREILLSAGLLNYTRQKSNA